MDLAPSIPSQPEGRSARIVVVTGAARGIGRAIASRFGAAGDVVIVTDIDFPRAQACAREIGAAAALHMDVCDAAQVNAVLQRLDAEHGAIDVLVNNAGLMTTGPFAQTAGDSFGAMLDVNVKGIFDCVQAVAPLMIRRRQGVIINIASVSSVRGGGSVGNVWYGASKAAVVAMTSGLARELGPHGVRVNAISPGVIETDMVRQYMTPTLREKVLTRFPLARLATVDDVARMALFLASSEAAFVSGQTVAVDGGFLTT
jgi:NAD(P)-dependent dehydrogenase (short-subunit alcohol dehydrogenase family)